MYTAVSLSNAVEFFTQLGMSPMRVGLNEHHRTAAPNKNKRV